MIEYATRNMGDGVRVRWWYDEFYDPRGSFALDTEEATREAEEWEMERLQDGRLVALGATVEYRCEGCECPHCTGWHPIETTYYCQGNEWKGPQDLWGIVIEPDEGALDDFARETFELEHPKSGKEPTQ